MIITYLQCRVYRIFSDDVTRVETYVDSLHLKLLFLNNLKKLILRYASVNIKWFDDNIYISDLCAQNFSIFAT